MDKFISLRKNENIPFSFVSVNIRNICFYEYFRSSDVTRIHTVDGSRIEVKGAISEKIEKALQEE